MDEEFQVPVKIDTYMFDIEKANSGAGEPEFEFHHTYSDTYGVKDLAP